MFKLNDGLNTTLLLTLFLCGCSSLKTQTMSGTAAERSPIVSPVPFAKETVMAPEGFVNCFAVKADYYDNVWIPEHRVCQYQNRPGQVAWVQGYWACEQYAAGQCNSWDWKPAHWSATLVSY